MSKDRPLSPAATAMYYFLGLGFTVVTRPDCEGSFYVNKLGTNQSEFGEIIREATSKGISVRGWSPELTEGEFCVWSS